MYALLILIFIIAGIITSTSVLYRDWKPFNAKSVKRFIILVVLCVFLSIVSVLLSQSRIDYIKGFAALYLALIYPSVMILSSSYVLAMIIRILIDAVEFLQGTASSVKKAWVFSGLLLICLALFGVSYIFWPKPMRVRVVSDTPGVCRESVCQCIGSEDYMVGMEGCSGLLTNCHTEQVSCVRVDQRTL
jgi:hypothetical protein